MLWNNTGCSSFRNCDIWRPLLNVYYSLYAVLALCSIFVLLLCIFLNLTLLSVLCGGGSCFSYRFIWSTLDPFVKCQKRLGLQVVRRVGDVLHKLLMLGIKCQDSSPPPQWPLFGKYTPQAICWDNPNPIEKPCVCVPLNIGGWVASAQHYFLAIQRLVSIIPGTWIGANYQKHIPFS